MLNPISDVLTVYATKISHLHIFYKCPHCEGPRGKHVIHKHGSDGNMSNRDNETRSPHCIDPPEIRGFKEVRIIINDETRRVFS